MFLALDTETGGIGLDKSLLTLYAVMLDDNLVPVKVADCGIPGAVPLATEGWPTKTLEISIKLKPNDGIYKVTGESLGINRINLTEHDKEAITYKEGGTLLYAFLEECYAESRRLLTGNGSRNKTELRKFSEGDSQESKEVRLIPVGHNVAFDCAKIKECLVSSGTWEKFVSYRVLDTCSIARFLLLCGKLPKMGCGTEELVAHFGIKLDGTIHDAKVDTMACTEILKRMIALINPPSQVGMSM